jgi:hypothetical protein
MPNTVYIFRMPGNKNLNADDGLRADCEPTSESELFDEPTYIDRVTRDAEDPIEAKEIVRKKAAWCWRISVRKTRMFRLARAGELAMSTTIAPLGILATVQSLSKGRFEGAATGVIGILWSLGVAREAVKDFYSQDYRDLVENTAQRRMDYNVAMASLEI